MPNKQCFSSRGGGAKMGNGEKDKWKARARRFAMANEPSMNTCQGMKQHLSMILNTSR